MVPQRAAADAKHQVQRRSASHGVDPRDLHRGGADVEDAELGLIDQALADGERHRRADRADLEQGIVRARVRAGAVRLGAERSGANGEGDAHRTGGADDGARLPRRQQLAPRLHPRGPLHQVVARRGGNRVHPAGVRREPREQLGAGTPAVGCEQRRRIASPSASQRLAEHAESQGAEARHGVLDSRYGEQPRGPLAGEPQCPRRPAALLPLLRYHQVRSRLDPLDHLLHALRRVHEVGVQRDRTVALRAVGAL